MRVAAILRIRVFWLAEIGYDGRDLVVRNSNDQYRVY